MGEDNSNLNSPSGTNPDAGSEGKSDFVPYGSHVKVIDEAKTAKRKLADANARLAEIDAQNKLQNEKMLLEEKNFTELLTQKNSEIERLSGEVSDHVKDKRDFRKMNAAVGLLQQKGINLDPKYMDLLPTDQIMISEESGEVVSDSVVSVVENFQKEHPRLVTPIGKMLPNQKSGQGLAKLSAEEWKKLSPKDRQSAYKEGRIKR